MQGTKLSYFNCTERRLGQIKDMIKKIPSTSLEFMEARKCNF